MQQHNGGLKINQQFKAYQLPNFVLQFYPPGLVPRVWRRVMSLEDPFFVVKDEVFKALNKTRGLYLRWRELGDSSGAEVEWTTTELRNSLRSIEWDLEDLEDTIDILLNTKTIC
uniref:Syntaxin 6/10/61 N-terminal domain-containing protein n=1 Tax=Phlebotomus papatasi TaxID=29031 RepID=A0A1B0D9L8_PHLPP